MTVTPATSWILPLDIADATPARCGGKGANLARLARAGLRVPPGFLITTPAYGAYLAENDLLKDILAALPAGVGRSPDLLDRAAAEIRGRFAQGRLSDGLRGAICAAYAELGRPAVAVRSSATAEDLPEASFAGQQDTYLNVTGEESLLRAVIDCWSSLWTARAIGYRERNGVPHLDAALAVVVQQMVESQASGVLFTANPLTGVRREAVIDATLGLGEALVSGQVEPDHYVVDTATGQIATRTLGAKGVAVRGRAGGGTVTVAEDARGRQALPDREILALAALGQRVAALYDAPQDVEWAWADDTLYLLQARPITSLYPLPANLPANPLHVFFSFGAVQGLLDPITPLGQDTLRQIFATGAGLFGMHVTRETQTALYTAGERLWIHVTSILHNSVGRKVARSALGILEPTIGQAVEAIWDDPALQPPRQGLSRQGAARLARFGLPLAGNVALNLLRPDARRRLIVANGEQVLERIKAGCADLAGPPRSRLAQLAVSAPDMINAYLPQAFTLFVSGVASGMAAFNLLNVLAGKGAADAGGREQPGWSDRVLEITRGLPHNPTTEMDLALWQVAQVIRPDPVAWAVFREFSMDDLAVAYEASALPAAAQGALGRFMQRYGGRGLAEIDMGRPRWSENPAPILDVLRGYLRIEDAGQAPDAVFARGRVAAQAAAEELIEQARQGRAGWLRSRLVRFAIARTRALMGLREAPKFFAVRMLAIVRRSLLEIGRDLVRAGELTQADDLVFLSWSELEAFAGGAAEDWVGLVATRRAVYRREFLRRQVPRVLLGDGRAFYAGTAGPADEAGTLIGSPVSPGSVRGAVRVVLDPRQAGLLPGEIMVCPGTDPSWTPLFLTAAGLVMEVGGMMTHGAVVAREYGIPAIVGVDRATERLQTGQQIEMDGSSGRIKLLDT
jgi:rifampicin phosphotransferase